MSRERAVALVACCVLLNISCAHGSRAGAGSATPDRGGGASASSEPSGEGSGGATDTSDGDASITAPDATHDQRGVATWYGAAFAGKPTASGERFDPSAMTAAHRKLHFGTWVEVCRVDGASTSRCVRVRINDRGPFGHTERVIDLSKHAADRLGIVRDGSAEVTIHVVDGP